MQPKGKKRPELYAVRQRIAGIVVRQHARHLIRKALNLLPAIERRELVFEMMVEQGPLIPPEELLALNTAPPKVRKRSACHGPAPTHMQAHGAPTGSPACCSRADVVTTDPRKVTCGTCRRMFFNIVPQVAS